MINSNGTNLREVVENALRELDSLGSADKIANYFRQQNITGRKMNPCQCPLANFLKEYCNIGYVISGVDMVFYGKYPGVSCGKLDSPENVRDFVVNFDMGDYQDLIQF